MILRYHPATHLFAPYKPKRGYTVNAVTIWNVNAYVSSDMPLTAKVLPVMSLQFIVVSPDEPSKELIEALVSAHTRNCVLLMAEVEQNEVPEDILPGN